jgi:IS66 Orf2 like protein
VWAYGKPTDLQKGYNGLVGFVENELRSDVMSGDLYLFVNFRRTGCKVLLWDSTGLCIFMKEARARLLGWICGQVSISLSARLVWPREPAGALADKGAPKRSLAG